MNTDSLRAVFAEVSFSVPEHTNVEICPAFTSQSCHLKESGNHIQDGTTALSLKSDRDVTTKDTHGRNNHKKYDMKRI